MTKVSPSTALSDHAHGRTDLVRVKLREAMKTIEIEIDQNAGIYPLHGGRLSLAEVCRRAGVHKVTLQGPSHRETSKTEIENWIKRLKESLITGRKSVRRTVTARADDWEARYKAVANKFNEMYAIEVIAKDKMIRELTEKVTTLEAENLTLVSDLSMGKVIRFPPKAQSETPTTGKRETDEPNLVLIRGVPGSGKSTLAASYKGHAHFEADMYFGQDGVYKFDPDLLPAAHQWCLQQTRDALEQVGRVVVSNTFANAWEIKPYIDLGCIYKVVQADGHWPSIHAVDAEKVERMRSTWVSNEKLLEEVKALSHSGMPRRSN